MTRLFVSKSTRQATLRELPPSSNEMIQDLARLAGLDLPDEILKELYESYPAFEAMVRRLPRDANYFDDPALIFDAELAGDVSQSARRNKDTLCSSDG